MAEIVNPYIAGAPVIEQRMFFGREDIFQWIESSIAGQFADHILVVHGQRRVGKTSVLKQLSNRLPKRFIPVFFDLQGRTHTTLDHFLWWLARETVRVLKQERNIEVPAPDKKAFSSDPEFFENQFLTSLRSSLGSNTLLLTFDEFDNLEESEVKEELARPLVDHLRRLMGQPNLNFIFSIGSSGRKLENMQAAYTDFFKTALYKKISFLSEEQTRNLVTRPVAGIIEYERAAVERIYRITSGHPYFTQLTCHELFARCQRTEQRKIAVADVESVLDDVVERGTVNLKFVWDEASDIEKWSLAALAQLDKTDNRALADFLRKNRVRFSETDLTSGLLHLREKDVLTPQNRFVIHLLRIWLQKNRPIEQAREELTEANPIASRFIEIGLEFRDGGQHEKAIEFFRQALSVASDNLQAQVNIALTYAAQGQLEQAIAEFEKALTIDDEDVASRSGLCDAHLALGDAAMKRGRTKESVLSYQRVLAINAEHLEARQRMAELSRQRAEKALTDGKDEEALSAFAEALKFTPEDQSLIARSEKVRAEKNAKVLAEQISRSEKDAAARNWEKAIEALNAALEIAPGDESILKRIESIKQSQLRERLDALLAKVEAAEKAGRWDTAISTLNEYLQLKPEDAAIQKRIANLVEAKHTAWLNGVMARVERAASAQNWDEALSALNEALRLEPNNAEMQSRAAQVREMRRVAELNARLQRADQAAGAGRWDEAINILNDGLASDPENEKLKTKLAEARKAKREARLQAALRFADSAAQAGKWEAAVASLNEVLANEPDNAEFQQKLTELRAQEHGSRWNAAQTQTESLREAERFAEALQVWQAYLSLYPDDHERVDGETKPITQERELFDLYGNAEGAIAERNFDKAIPLLKEIIIRDENYKDSSRLLTRAIESRRTGTTQKLSKPRTKPASPKPVRAPKTGGKRTWVIGGLLAILILGIGGGLFWLGKNNLLSIFPIPTNDAGSTIIVISAEDSGTGTFRQALLDAQTGDTIKFDTEVFPPDNPTTIFLSKAYEHTSLPEISQGNITIDASDAGVILNGINARGEWVSGLEIRSNGNTVMGLQIINFSGAGIALSWGNSNVIRGNRIYKNRDSGIVIETGPIKNIIGPDNVITENGSYGVAMRGIPAHDNTITANSIYDNSGPGIYYNLSQGVPTPPSILDFDLEAGTVNGQTCQDCVVEIFSTDTRDGKIYEGTATADENGNFSFDKDEALSGPFLTATSRSPGNSTSEFSPPISSNIQTALDAIQNEAPLYQTSFNTWDFGDPIENVSVENGKLVVTSENDEHTGANVYNLASDRFAVEFELRVTETSPGGHCIFEIGSDSIDNTYRAISAEFHENSRAVLSHHVGGGRHEELAATSYDVTKGNTVTLIILGDQIAAFINGQLAYTALDPDGSAFYAHQALSTSDGNACEYDNFKIWDLSELDPAIQIALDVTQREEPDYQTGFDAWDFEVPEDHTMKIENGKLILTSEWANIGLPLESRSSDRFAVEFEFRILESGPEGTCFFGTNNDGGGEETHRSLGAGFAGNSRAFLEHYVHPDQSLPIAESSYAYDDTNPNTVRFIVLGDQIAVFVNGQLAYTALNPDGSVVYSFQSFSAEWDVVCEYDNYKIWDLSGVDFSGSAEATTAFYEPILAAIQDREPDFQDDFSTSNNEWGNTSEGIPISEMLKVGALSIRKNNNASLTFPTNGLFDATDFAIQFDLDFNSNMTFTNITFQFRTSADQNSDYKIKLFDRDETGMSIVNEWQFIDTLKSQPKKTAFGFKYLKDGFRKILIIARQGNLVIYIDDDLLLVRDDITLTGQENLFIINTEPSDDYIWMDNVKFWNLDGVDFNP